jgi:hypothetical protein
MTPPPPVRGSNRGGTCKLAAISRRKKKLPQAGQEPVEAVESRHISPDGAHLTRSRAATQRYSAKIFRHFTTIWRNWEIPRRFIDPTTCRPGAKQLYGQGFRPSRSGQKCGFQVPFPIRFVPCLGQRWPGASTSRLTELRRPLLPTSGCAVSTAARALSPSNARRILSNEPITAEIGDSRGCHADIPP